MSVNIRRNFLRTGRGMDVVVYLLLLSNGALDVAASFLHLNLIARSFITVALSLCGFTIYNFAHKNLKTLP